MPPVKSSETHNAKARTHKGAKINQKIALMLLGLVMRSALIIAGVLVICAGAARAIALLHRNGDVIAYTALHENGVPRVALYDIGHQRLMGITRGALSETLLGWSRDGDQLAVARDQTSRGGQPRSVIIDLSTASTHEFYNTGAYAAFSPDGHWLALNRLIGASEGALINVDLQTGISQRVTPRDMQTSGSPAWSPDGQHVLFGGRVGAGSYQIYRYELTTDAIIRLTDYVGNNASPRPSPDGRYVLFQSLQRRSMAVMIIDADGSMPRSLTAGDGFCELPTWSPDSTRVAVICEGLYGTFGKALFLAHINSRDVDFLAATVREIHPQWIDNGDAILFVGDDGYFYRIAAPSTPLEGTTSARPLAERISERQFFGRETYVGVSVRP